MKKWIWLLFCFFVFPSTAFAAFGVEDSRPILESDEFMIAYCPYSDTYYAVIGNTMALGTNKIYRISGNPLTAQLIDRTSGRVIDLLPTPEGCYYSADSLWIPTTQNIYFFDTKNNSVRCTIKYTYGALAYNDDQLLYWDSENSGSSWIWYSIKTKNKQQIPIPDGYQYYHAGGCLFLHSDSNNAMLAFYPESSVFSSYPLPENFTRTDKCFIYKDYLVNADTLKLYKQGKEFYDVSFIDGMHNIQLGEKYLIATDKETAYYITLDRPETLYTIDLPPHRGYVALCNNKLFSCTETGNISYVDLISGETQIIILSPFSW